MPQHTHSTSEEDKDIEMLSCKMSNTTINDIQCPLCNNKLQYSNEEYKCRGYCHLAHYLGTKKWIEGLKEKIMSFTTEHR